MRFLSIVVVVGIIVLFAVSSIATAGGTIKGKVTDDRGNAISFAQVIIEGSTMGASANKSGEYVIRNVPPGSYTLRTRVIGYHSQTAKVKVSEGEEVTQDFSLQEGIIEFAEIVSVGSRFTHTVADELAVPVDVFTETEIRRSGTTEVNQLIQLVAPSFNFPRPSITDGTDTVRPATLRGLGPDQVLVLLNGKRRHTSALVHVNGSVGRGSTGVDLNAIPASAIERVEILRDGAAAQYGSDAIAGVISMVMKSGVSPLTLSAQGGTTTHGDGEMVDVNASYGLGLGRGSLFLSGEFRDRNPTNRAGDDPRDQIRAGDAGNNSVSQPNHHWGDSEARDYMGFANLNFPLNASGSTKFYAFGGYSHRFGSHGGFYRRGLDDRNWPQIYPLGFLPTIEPDVDDLSATAGIKGVTSNWIYDLSAQFGRNKYDFNVVNSLNTSLGPNIPPNQTEFYSGGFRFNQYLFNLDVSRQFNIGLPAPLNLALGAEFRRENYIIVAGEPNSYIDGKQRNQFGRVAAPGAQVFPGFKPENEIDEFRSNVAVYVDLETNLLNNLLVGVAGRYEDYDDFGNTTDGKISLRWQPEEQFVLRGAASTGFRAPSLGQIYFNATSTNFLTDPATGEIKPFEVGTFRVDSPVAKALGAEPLRPEESKNFSAGFAVDPLSNLQITVDFYRIDIDDRIVFSENFNAASLQPLLQPFGVNGARFFTNAINTETRGVDVTANYRLDLGNAGSLKLSGAFNDTQTKIVGTLDTPPQLKGFESVLFGDLEKVRLEDSQPKSNLKFSATYSGSKLSAFLRLNYYGEYESIERGYIKGRTDQTFGAEDVWDVEVGYKFGNLNLAVGSQNVLDNFPDKNLRINNTLDRSFFGIFPFPGSSPFGMNGRFLYARTSYSL
jgi:iron complex outermembrane receptor protein